MRSSLLLAAVGQAAALTIKHQHVARAPTDWNYHGCWTDEGDRQLGGESFASDTMTPALCISFCETQGYQFAGVEYANECFCGHQIRSASVKKEDTECSMACIGNSAAVCGGPNRLNIYTSGAATAVTTNPGPIGSGWNYLSCYEDSVYERTLSVRVDTLTPNNVDVCTSACKGAGYKYAGVEWSSECWCGDEIRAGRTGGFGQCDMVCSGNPNEYCGGSQRMNLYELVPLISSSTTTTSSTTSEVLTTSTITSSTTSTTTSSTTSEVPTTSSTTSSTTSESPSPTTTSTASTTTTTSTTTTSSLGPIVTAFHLSASSENTNINGKILKWYEHQAGIILLFNPTNTANYKEGIFSLEPGTNRLKVGSYYVIRSNNNQLFSVTLPGQLTTDGYTVCTPPVRLGQALSCVGPANSSTFRTSKTSGSNVGVVFLPGTTPLASNHFFLQLIPVSL